MSLDTPSDQHRAKRRRLDEATASYSSFAILSFEPEVVSWDRNRSPDVSVGCDPSLSFAQDFQSNAQGEDGREVATPVCFGLISGLPGRCEQRGSFTTSAPFPVELDSSGRFTSPSCSIFRGMVLSKHCQLINGLLEEPSVKLFVSCVLDETSVGPRAERSSVQLSCTLQITVYGAFELFEEIGEWLESYGMRLQDPLTCDWDVRYCNPQRLSSIDIAFSPMVSDVVARSTKLLDLQDISDKPDLLEILSSRLDFEETPQPPAIRANLKRHQKQALTFMLRRERGWCFEEADVWERLTNDHGQAFVNRITGFHELEEPLPFYGGIVADPMGLGKTLAMIALVATDKVRETPSLQLDCDEEGKYPLSATLIIIPPPLIGSWQEQLSQHVLPGGLEWRLHHGKSRIAGHKELAGVDIVLTTYHTVSADWKSGSSSDSSALFSARWRRIVLDEAHFIRNGNSRMARATCALAAVARWAVTGTPIQNRLGDLATLLKFIRAHPYSDPKQFETDISALWKSGKHEEAGRRLQYLSTCLLLRRPKSTISLPPRRDMQCPVQFSREERELYEKIRDRAITKIDEALHNDTESSKSGAYVNILQQIESMRLICNLGLHYHTRHDKSAHPSSDDGNWVSIAQHTFNVQRGMGPIICLQCSSTLDLTESLLDDNAAMRSASQFSRCLAFTCTDCIQKHTRVNRRVVCGHSPPCPTAPVYVSSSTLEEIPDLYYPQQQRPSPTLPSKIRALVGDIISLPSHTKCIVFSTWRLTLDLIEAGLGSEGIQSVRFDGKVPQKDRDSVVERFKKNPSIRVMLLTLSCGAVGLTLTEASRAYLMEPHWNPTLEEQALARIHRIGQTQEVTTVRFYVRDSFEEQVIKLQNSKKHLADIILSHHDGGKTDALEGLHKLRSLL